MFKNAKFSLYSDLIWLLKLVFTEKRSNSDILIFINKITSFMILIFTRFQTAKSVIIIITTEMLIF